MNGLVLGALLGAGAVSGLRWLRVAQREHYLTGSATRFALRWWLLGTPSISLLAVGLVAASAMLLHPLWGLIVAGVAAIGPPGLALRGRTSPLAWTPRLRRLGGVTALYLLLCVAAGWAIHPVVAAAAVLACPLLVDAAIAAVAPLERRLGAGWVDRAARALSGSGATVVAVTGSYGKTSTKGHIAQLLAGSRRVLPSPASFNNRMGLARAINEHLAGGIDVFVAEMGTYGRGEIAELCSWIPPDVAVITAIGPVHLERFGSEDRIVEAKSEILQRASVAILNVDDARLRQVAEKEGGRRTVITVGSGDSDVVVTGGRITAEGRDVGSVPTSAHPTNVACAVAVAMALDVPLEEVAGRLGDLAEPEHRMSLARGSTGALVIDDTFNSNPAGAGAALHTLAVAEVGGRRVVVTPGMVELGARQWEENRRFAARASKVADQLLIVGRTNRRALCRGAAEGTAEVVLAATREDAVQWVRDHLGDGDAVLYENDLPDHYP